MRAMCAWRRWQLWCRITIGFKIEANELALRRNRVMGWAPKLMGLCGAAASPWTKGHRAGLQDEPNRDHAIADIGKTELHEQGDRYEIRR
jgi:hypothetical protein